MCVCVCVCVCIYLSNRAFLQMKFPGNSGIEQISCWIGCRGWGDLPLSRPQGLREPKLSLRIKCLGFHSLLCSLEK